MASLWKMGRGTHLQLWGGTHLQVFTFARHAIHVETLKTLFVLNRSLSFR